MKLEDQVVSLELSQKLKELGVKQESLFVWRGVQDWRFGPLRYTLAYVANLVDDSNFPKIWKIRASKVVVTYSAFTVAELGEMLPAKHQQIKLYRRHLGEWVCRWDYGTSPTGCHMETSNTEANARAKMLIYLLENELITV